MILQSRSEMSVREELDTLATAIQSALRNKKLLVKIVIKNRSIKTITHLLEGRNLIKIKSIKGDKYELLVTANDFCLMNGKVIKAKDVMEFSRKVFPHISGILIISTPKGIMSHEDAHEKNVGGKILLGAY